MPVLGGRRQIRATQSERETPSLVEKRRESPRTHVSLTQHVDAIAVMAGPSGTNPPLTHEESSNPLLIH
jgi:hypothetical protein